MGNEAAVGLGVRLWTLDDVSAYLQIPKGTLYQWRCRGEGPPCIRMGKHLRYVPEQVVAWAVGQAA